MGPWTVVTMDSWVGKVIFHLYTDRKRKSAMRDLCYTIRWDLLAFTGCRNQEA